MKDDKTYLDDLVYSILYIASQGGCNEIRKISDPERFCNILGRGGRP
jgi:hypothetical protein